MGPGKTFRVFVLALFTSVSSHAISISTEAHLFLCPTQGQNVSESLGFPQSPENYFLWFFENEDLELLNNGLVMRLKEYPGSAKEKMTYKVPYNPLNPPQDSWSDREDFKCEKDFYNDHESIKCSLTQKHRNVDNILYQNANWQSLLDEDSHAFLDEFAQLDPREKYNILTLGRISVTKIENGHIDLEHWFLPNSRESIWELSQKSTEQNDAPELLHQLEKLAWQSDVEICRNQHISKSRLAIEDLSESVYLLK